MARRKTSARRRVAAAVLLVLLLAAGWIWWQARTWHPDRTRFPVQGLWVDVHDGAVDWRMVKARGADFAYLTASEGAGRRDEAFTPALDAVREQGLQAGAVHVYDLCAKADAQAARFVTIVPRDARLLPPAVALDLDQRSCAEPPSEAALQSELTTFLNQVERHAGKPAILMVTRGLESRYHLAASIDRNLWLVQNFFEPGYAGRPFVLWTASDRLRLDGVPGPVRWVAVQP